MFKKLLPIVATAVLLYPASGPSQDDTQQIRDLSTKIIIQGEMDRDGFIFKLNDQVLTIQQVVCNKPSPSPSPTPTPSNSNGSCPPGTTSIIGGNGSNYCVGTMTNDQECSNPEITVGDLAKLHEFELDLVAVERQWQEIILKHANVK
jgi:hypothetical protein